jgi:peptidoglycan hydrolase CwlO-like protein
MDPHTEIWFEGKFTALCPLCALKIEKAEAIEKAEREAAAGIDDAEQEASDAQSLYDEMKEKNDKLETEMDGLKAEIKELKEKNNGKD